MVFLSASQLGADQTFTGSTCRTTSLDHCSHLHTRIRHLLVHLDLLHKTFSDRMLCDSHHQPRLLRSNSVGMLFDMSTFRLQLESVHSRNMWRPEVLGSVHWSVQPVDGHRDRLVTFTRFVGASDADWKEARFERHILHGHSVRVTVQI